MIFHAQGPPPLSLPTATEGNVLLFTLFPDMKGVCYICRKPLSNYAKGCCSRNPPSFTRGLMKFLLHMSLLIGFGGLEVACCPLVPKFAGSNPAESVGFLRAKKILSTPSFGGEVKPSVPCRRFAACKRSLELRGSRILDEICSTFRC